MFCAIVLAMDTYTPAFLLLQQDDTVLRLPGDPTGTGEHVETARERGLPVYTGLDETPSR